MDTFEVSCRWTACGCACRCPIAEFAAPVSRTSPSKASAFFAKGPEGLELRLWIGTASIFEPFCWLCQPTEAPEQNVELNYLDFVYYDVGR
jgi:hypothetical protein